MKLGLGKTGLGLNVVTATCLFGLVAVFTTSAQAAGGDSVNCKQCVDTKDIAKKAVTRNRLATGVQNTLDSVGGLVHDVNAIHGKVGNLKDDVTAVHGKVSALKEDVDGLKGDVTAVHNKVNGLDTRVGNLEPAVTALQTNLADLNAGFAAFAEVGSCAVLDGEGMVAASCFVPGLHQTSGAVNVVQLPGPGESLLEEPPTYTVINFEPWAISSGGRVFFFSAGCAGDTFYLNAKKKLFEGLIRNAVIPNLDDYGAPDGTLSLYLQNGEPLDPEGDVVANYRSVLSADGACTNNNKNKHDIIKIKVLHKAVSARLVNEDPAVTFPPPYRIEYVSP